MNALLEYHVTTVLVVVLYTIALIGWGASIRLALTLAATGVGFDAVLGIAGATCVGGLLNLAGLVTRGLLQALLLGGGLAAIWIHRRSLAQLVPLLRSWRAEPLAAIGMAVCALLLLRDLMLSDVRPFCDTDDFQAYLVFPQKLLLAGCLADNPYSARRIESSLGGQYILDALLLALTGLERLNALEQGVGRLVVALAVWGLARGYGISRSVSLLPLALTLIFWPMLVNLTSVMTGIALFIGMLHVLASEPGRGRLPALALLSAGLCSLKSSHIPATALMLGAGVLCDPRQRLMLRLRDALTLAALTLLLLAPWMLDMYRATGTPLYPVLGRGHHGTAFGTYEKPNQGIRLRDFLRPLLNLLLGTLGLVILALSALGLWWRVRPALTIMATTALAAMAASALLFFLLTSGSERYILAFLMPAFLMLALQALVPSESDRGPQRVLNRLALLATAFLLGDGWNTSRIEFGRYPSAPPTPAYRDVHEGAEELQRLQQGIPRGEAILARVAKPFQFDFSRNPICELDWPGGASPPPGLQTAAPAEDIARFFREHGIRWLAYSYADEAAFSHARHDGETASDQPPWTRINAYHTLDFQDRLVELGRRYRHAGDDGRTFILDLQTPGAAAGEQGPAVPAAPAKQAASAP